ncbi:MAG: DUF5678 domain-containing protein [Candidatus Gracilibacteria bacterium]
MKFEAKHAGKWVAVQNQKVIASGSTLSQLKKKIEAKPKSSHVGFALIPKGYIAGIGA